MSLLPISEGRRETMQQRCELSVDKEGREVSTGLTREESEWMLSYEAAHGIEARMNGAPAGHGADKKRRVALNEKHRSSVILARGRRDAGIQLH